MRKPIIIGNWKMNNGPEEAHKFYNELNNLLKGQEVDVDWAIAAPSLSMISLFPETEDGLYVPLAAQNVNENESGAYTGEVSLSMLMEYNVEYVIIGHSERREYYNETNQSVNAKVLSTLNKSDLTPVMAFGETEEQFNNKETLSVIKKQLEEGLVNVDHEDMKDVVLAYEPIWAIGTGKTATPEQAQLVIKSARDIIENMFSKEVAEEVRIQYGGSVKPENIKELMKQPDIDGGLVGGASLIADSFHKLITFNK